MLSGRHHVANETPDIAGGHCFYKIIDSEACKLTNLVSNLLDMSPGAVSG
jgi:hypothetical protein